jgi:diguanylate cyclase (GGDEF)-like protein
MIKSIGGRLNSLRVRILSLFLLVVMVVLFATVYIVRSATYEHSTEQLVAHAETSAKVVRDKLTNQAIQLNNGLEGISKNFSLMKLFAEAREDQASLVSAMNNYQTRLEADFFIVVDDQLEVLASSIHTSNPIEAQALKTESLVWQTLQQKVYLVKAVPIRFVTKSSKINGWILMGLDAEKMISQDLKTLTDMHISLINPMSSPSIFASTFDSTIQRQLSSLNLATSDDLQDVILAGVIHKYTMERLEPDNPDSSYYIMMATPEDHAYVSYKNLIGKVFGLLAIAATLALLAALLLSNTITRPIDVLVTAARRISEGKIADKFPHSSTNEVNSLSFAIKDMQDGIRRREEQINELAFFDKLTGLPNRNQFNAQLNDTINQSNGQKVLIAMMDIDRFKEINDTVGHNIGDKLLTLVAARLVNYSNGKEFYARLGGDEFGMIFSTPEKIDAIAIACDIESLFEHPFNLEGLVLDVEASIGLATYPDDAQDPQGLMQCADIALYSCKGHHNSYAVYQESLNKHSVQRLNLMSELKEALAAGELELYYQPKLTIAENSFDTVECLIRWIHPEHGFIPPDEFIGLAEQTGAIRHVTSWGLREAIKQHKEWKKAGHNFGMAVNISALDLVDMKLPKYVEGLLEEFSVAPEMLTIEVTESAIMSEPQSAIKALNTLRNMGIILSIDDFGTGFSSMAQLKKMPVDELKIDKAFVLDLATNQEDQVMVKTLVTLAQNLGLRTVAEGVEDQEALDFLTHIGCTKAQGYYLSRPLPIDKFNEWHAKIDIKAG